MDSRKAQLTVEEMQRKITRQIAAVSENTSLEAQVLLSQAMDRSRTWIVSHPEIPLTAGQFKWLTNAVQQYLEGVPLPYVLRKWEFFGLSFQVSPDVLIPRPETELIVEQALEWSQKGLRGGLEDLQIVDVGTGSGCIAISLLVNLPQDARFHRLIASDISMDALKVARANAEQHQVISRISFLQANNLNNFQSKSLDLICANPPYIPRTKLGSLAVSQNEPLLALDGGPSGLDQIKPLLDQAAYCLRPGGLLLLEIEESQGPIVIELSKAIFKTNQVEVLKDYSHRDRLLRIQL